MKYVRTKDGKVFAKITWSINGEKIIGNIGIDDFYQECDIEKEADTIEELCDEFILFDKDNLVYIPIAIDFDSKEYIFKYANEDYIKMTKIADTDEIYGAIWTDKGLIYVAKMNKEGELELI